jgi:hypothetical protein
MLESLDSLRGLWLPWQCIKLLFEYRGPQQELLAFCDCPERARSIDESSETFGQIPTR